MKPAFIGIPWDEMSSFLRGAAEAPPLIRQALLTEASNGWSETGRIVDAAAIYDAGDLETGAGVEMLARIEQAIADLLHRNFKPISLGGDHAITYPILRAF